MLPKKIGTHDGSFHCDEALACFLLHQTDEFRDAEIIRTRNPTVLETLDILVDVGAVYDPSRHRYDHHQASFSDTFDEHHTIRLSSAGLIYKHFGRKILEKLTGLEDELLEVIYQKTYTDLIEGVDAIDNGISQYQTDILPRYHIGTDLGARVSRLNPSWNDTTKKPDEQFKLAVALTGSEFLEIVNDKVKSWLPARAIVEEMVNGRFDVDPSGAIGILSQSCPWKSFLQEIEEEKAIKNELQYILFSDRNDWRIQSVPLTPQSFESRAPLPVAWRGLRDQELSNITGIEGCIFAHATGFIGGNKTKEGVLAMAREALKLQEKKN